jgi:hypothetical protein
MRAGRIEQCAPMEALRSSPATEYVAALLARALGEPLQPITGDEA